MDGVDCDWCLVCEKKTSNGAAYCSQDCRTADLISSSASSDSSAASDSSAYFCMTESNGAPLVVNDNYPMPPFIRKQRTSIPNIYAHCASTPNPHPSPLSFTPSGNTPSALSHHFQLQKQHQQQQSQNSQQQASLPPQPTTSASQYPMFYANLNALRPS